MENTNRFYNYEIKERFINSIENQITKTFSIYPLKKARAIEKSMGKDMYDMTLDELSEVLGELSCSGENAVYNNILKIEEYIKWAARNGFRKTNISPFSSVDKVEWSKQFVATYRNYYFTKDQIFEMMDKLVNPSEKAVLLALFEGIKGNGFSELLNLKENDIREKDGIYQARLKSKTGETRVIEISEKLAQVLINTANRPDYVNKNGKSSGGHYEKVQFIESDKIFKKTKRGKQDGELDGLFVNRKFIVYKEEFGFKHLKTKHITDSGMMHLANILQKNGVLTTVELNQIAEQFNTSYTSAPRGGRYRNTTVIKKVIQNDAFEELYGYEMKFQ